MSRGVFFAIVLVVSAVVGAHAGTIPTIQGLGDLPGGAVWSSVGGCSPNGRWAVGGSESDFGGMQAYLWSEETGMIGLGQFPGGYFSYGFGVSNDGRIVAGQGITAEDYHRAFRWTAETGVMQDLGVFASGSTRPDSMAWSMTADGGKIVGWAQNGRYEEAFIWSEDTGLVGLGSLPGGTVDRSAASDITPDGRFITGVSSSTPSGYGWEAFRWSAGQGMRGLGDLPGDGFYSEAFGISADGTTVVGYSRVDTIVGSPHAFRWTEATGMADLGGLPGMQYSYTVAEDVSGDGALVVGWGEWFDSKHAWLWREDLGIVLLEDYFTDLGGELAGWNLEWARAISDDGSVIFGTGTDPDGHYGAYRIVIPEPSGALLLLTSMFLLLGCRRTVHTRFLMPKENTHVRPVPPRPPPLHARGPDILNRRCPNRPFPSAGGSRRNAG